MTAPRPAHDSKCRLCGQIAGEPASDLVHAALQAREYVRRVGPEAADAVTVPSIGPLAVGHVLVCPREHARSLAAAGRRAQRDVEALSGRLAEALESDFAVPVHRFEHGNATEGRRVACSVEHAHLHLVPTDVPLWEALRERLIWVELDPSLEKLGDVTQGEEYVLYQHPDRRRFAHLPGAAGVESQLLRRELARLSGAPSSWNWREHPELDRLERTWSWLNGQCDRALAA